jgi:Tfp pilus assembly protein PilX
MRLLELLLHRLRGEQGFVMPTAAIVLGLAVLTAGVAATQTVTAQEGSVHERHAKRALQAADAGVEAAMYRMNRLGASRAAETNKCVTINAASGDATLTNLPGGGTYTWNGDSAWSGGTSGWCDAVTQQTDDGASYSYRVSGEALDPTDTNYLRRMVVSTGTYQGISRRVAVALQARRALPLFTGDFAVFSDRDFVLNSNSIIGGNAGSNGNITMDSNSEVCGNATPGAGKTVIIKSNAEVTCGGSTAPAVERFDLPPVVADLSVNDNARICAVGGDACTDQGSITWNATTRRLKLDSNSTITLGGSVYSFCYLELNSNSQIIIPIKPAGSAVKIYIDAPENCPASSPPPALPGSSAPNGLGSMLFDSNSKIINQNESPTSFQIYMLGSPTRETNAHFDSNAQATEVKFAFYAPYSEVELNSNVTFRGAFAAAQVYMDSNAQVIYDDSVEAIQNPAIYPQLRGKRWVECTRAPTTAGTHDSGC